jgi:Zn-dependent alcohol dehydrogenase
VAWDAGKELSLEDIEVAPPKAHEVRIEIHYTGVCHTGMTPEIRVPFPQGVEVIISTGPAWLTLCVRG